MPLYAVTAVGIDRPGVVAALSGVLVEQDCNLEDTQMAVLGSYAAMMLVVRVAERVTVEELQAALAEGTGTLGLAIWVQPIRDLTPREEYGSRWSVLVHGADRPGIVFEVTRLLAGADINIVDLHTWLRDRVYAMSMEVVVPLSTDGNRVAAELEHLAAQLGVACSMRPKPPDRGQIDSSPPHDSLS
jgi:glycine cleavage system transcriptional repressor